MLRVISCSLASLLASTAFANECTNPPYAPTIASFANQSGFEADRKEPIEAQAQSKLSPEGMNGLVALLCAAEQIEEDEYRHYYVRSVLHAVEAPDPEGLDKTIERFSTRLNMNIPTDDWIMFRADIAERSVEIALENDRLMAQNAELDKVIQQQDEEIARLETEIARLRAKSAELQAESAELQAESAELQAESAEIQARIAELNELLSDAKENLSMLKGMAAR